MPPKIIYAADGRTILEVDWLASDGKTILEADKYNNHLLQQVIFYSANGKTIEEVDTYAYNNHNQVTSAVAKDGNGTLLLGDYYSYQNNGTLQGFKEIDSQEHSTTQLVYGNDGVTITGGRVTKNRCQRTYY